MRNNKNLLSISLALAIFFITASFTQNVYAIDPCPRDNLSSCVVGNSCDRHCGSIYPENGVDPVTDPTQPSNCASRIDHINYGVQNVGSFGGYPKTAVTASYGHRYYYCGQNGQITAPSGGEVVVYARTVYLRVVGPGGVGTFQRTNPTETTGYLTGITVTAGQRFNVHTGEYNYTDGIGWRKYSPGTADSFFNAARNDANANGYIVISEQIWGDAQTGSNYDSFDFNDMAILVAVKPAAVPPSCAENSVTLSANPINDSNYLYLSESMRFTVSQGLDPSIYRNPTNTFKTNTAVDIGFASACSPSQNNQKDCQVTNKVTSGTTAVTWTHTYQNCVVGTGVCSPTCTRTLTFNIYPYPGVTTTTGGDVYIRNSLNQKRLSAFPGFAVSRFSFVTQNTQANMIPNQVNASTFLSGTNKLMFGYNDVNYAGNYYSQIYPIITENETLKAHYLALGSGGTTNLTQAMLDSYQTSASDKRLINVSGSLTIPAGLVCKSATIFLISGNLTVTPNFTIQGDNACLFIVAGTTTINQVANGQVVGYFLSGGFETVTGDGQLTLKGGFESASTTFNRNINRNVVQAASINKSIASERFIYEGGRYYKHFKEYLGNTISTSVRESNLN
jgi:hypothetical protein